MARLAPEIVRLLHGPDRALKLKRGARACCHLRGGHAVVTSWSDVRIPWPPGRGIEPVIAHQTGEKARTGTFDRQIYRRRNVIERCVGSLKWSRREATHYE